VPPLLLAQLNPRFIHRECLSAANLFNVLYVATKEVAVKFFENFFSFKGKLFDLEV
jgi:hypothetical protein